MTDNEENIPYLKIQIFHLRFGDLSTTSFPVNILSLSL